MQYHKSALAPYGLGHFLFVFCALYTSALHSCHISPCPRAVLYCRLFSLTISLLASFALFPASLVGQVQCRCWCLSIMKRWEGGGGEQLLFVLTRGWIIHPVEKSASPTRVCTILCVSETASLNVVMLYLAVVRVEMCFVSPWPHTHSILTTLQVIFISHAWFSLSLADAKWLSMLCMLFSCKVHPVARCDMQRENKRDHYVCLMDCASFSNSIQTNTIQTFLRPVWSAELARLEIFCLCYVHNRKWKIYRMREWERSTERWMHSYCVCNFMSEPLQLNGSEIPLWILLLCQFPLILELMHSV